MREKTFAFLRFQKHPQKFSLQNFVGREIQFRGVTPLLTTATAYRSWTLHRSCWQGTICPVYHHSIYLCTRGNPARRSVLRSCCSYSLLLLEIHPRSAKYMSARFAMRTLRVCVGALCMCEGHTYLVVAQIGLKRSAKMV